MKNNTEPLKFDSIRIKQIREYRKLSQCYVAKFLNIAQSSYSDIEKGSTKLKAEHIPILAKCLNVDIRCFFEAGLIFSESLALKDELEQQKKDFAELKKKHNKNIRLLIKTKRQYREYKIQSKELLEQFETRLRQKKFVVTVFLLASVLILYFFIFQSVIYHLTPSKMMLSQFIP